MIRTPVSVLFSAVILFLSTAAYGEIVRNNSGGKNVVLQSKVLFDLSKSELTPKAAGALNEIAALLNLYKTNVLVVEGHADNTGEKKYNEKLSAARAKAVYDFLAENGIEKYRMKAVSYGYTKPLNDNLTESERAENRRAEIIIFKGE